MTLAVMGGHDGYNVQATAAIAAVTTFLILFTIFGNVLVIIAVLTSRSLKAPQNLFLVSLAAADILVATLIIPFSLANELMGYWYFDKVWCKAYLALDVLFCTASIVHLCAISLDRYWSVSQAIEYNSKRTPRRIKCTILVVWLLAALISLPPLVFNTNPSEAQEDAKRCELNEQPWYILSSSTCSFFAPCLIMILVYVRIYFIAKRRSRKGSAPKKAKAGKKVPRIQITSSAKTLAGEGEPNGHQVTVQEELEPNGHHLGLREEPNGRQLIMRGEGEPDRHHLKMREEHKGHQLSVREEEHDGHQVTMREEPIGHHLEMGEEREPNGHQLRMGEEREPNGHHLRMGEEREPNGHEVTMRDKPNGHHLRMQRQGEPDGHQITMQDESNGYNLRMQGEGEPNGHQITMRDEPYGHHLRMQGGELDGHQLKMQGEEPNGHHLEMGEEREPNEHQLRMGEEREPNGHEVTMRDKPKGHHLRMQRQGEPDGHQITMRDEPNGHHLRMQGEGGHDGHQITMRDEPNGHHLRMQGEREPNGHEVTMRDEPNGHHLKMQGGEPNRHQITMRDEPNGHHLRLQGEGEPGGHQLKMQGDGEPDVHQLKMQGDGEPDVHQLKMQGDGEPNGHQLRMEREGEPNGHQVTIQEDDQPESHPFVSQEGKKTKPSLGMDTLATAKGEVLLVRRVKTLSANPWKRKTHLNREKRFTFVLAVVIGVFVVCWFPFFFLYSLRAVCSARRCPIPDITFKFFFWIGYCNSSLNPVIYTIFNQDFRKAFRRILCRQWTQTAW